MSTIHLSVSHWNGFSMGALLWFHSRTQLCVSLARYIQYYSTTSIHTKLHSRTKRYAPHFVVCRRMEEMVGYFKNKLKNALN